MADLDNADWQPISRLPLLSVHLSGGITMATMALSMLRQAHGDEYRLTETQRSTVHQQWSLNRDELLELYAEQGRRWRTLELTDAERGDLTEYAALVEQALRLSQEVIAEADGLKEATVEALLARGGDHLGIDRLLD